MIEVTDLTKSYGRHLALRGISFTVETGSIAGFLGPNGAGKSTAMKILTTYLPVTGGSARVEGLDVSRHPREVCRAVGYLPESMPVYPELRVEEYLGYRAGIRGLRGGASRRRVNEVMEECAILDVRRKLLGALSRGYRQRLGLADSLLHDPRVLILDEPTAGLDPRQVTEVRRMISSFRGRRTVFLSSHILGEVEQVCDQIIIIDEGCIRANESRESWQERLRQAGQLRLALDSPPADVVSQLEKVDGILQVNADESSFTMKTRGDRREAIFRLVVERGWKLLELYPVPATLESLFLEVTGARRSSGPRPLRKEKKE